MSDPFYYDLAKQTVQSSQTFRIAVFSALAFWTRGRLPASTSGRSQYLKGVSDGNRLAENTRVPNSDDRFVRVLRMRTVHLKQPHPESPSGKSREPQHGVCPCSNRMPYVVLSKAFRTDTEGGKRPKDLHRVLRSSRKALLKRSSIRVRSPGKSGRPVDELPRDRVEPPSTLAPGWAGLGA